MNDNIINDLENVRYHLTASKHKQVIDDALDLINRLSAENERLKAERQMADGYADALVEYTKEKAIKDYKERLIFEIVNTPTTYQESGLLYLSGVANRQNEIIDIINGLDEKETVGEDKTPSAENNFLYNRFMKKE